MDLQEIREILKGMYGGENKPILDGKYDPSLAAKCINGTFVGRKNDNWERTYFLTKYYVL